MSDDVKHEQPPGGGSYIRQKDGSLVRAGEVPAETKASDGDAGPAKTKTRGK